MTSGILFDWLANGPMPSQTIAFTANSKLSAEHFINQVAHYFEKLNQSNTQRWLLASDNSAYFAVGLCAGLLAGKDLILPPNTLVGTLADLTSEFDACLCDDNYFQTKSSVLLTDINSSQTVTWPTSKRLGRILLFTSGSSGAPKGVIKTVEQLDSEVSTLEATFSTLTSDTKVISAVSHQHIYGLLFKILWPLASKREFLIPQINYPETLSDCLKHFSPLTLIASPAQLSRLPESLGFKLQAHSPKAIFSSGGPLNLQSALGIKTCFGQLPFEVFGSTETGGIAYRQQASANSFWQSFEDIKVATTESSALKLKSPYLATKEWFVTEDKVSIEPDGSFQLLERLDRIVKVAEKRVSLQHMEQLLSEHQFVDLAAVIMLANPKAQLGAVIELSQLGKAYLAENGKLSLNNLFKNHLLSNFERVTLPKRWRYPTQLPLNSQGKRITQQLTELFVK